MRLERTVIGCHRTSSAIRRGGLTGALIASFFLVACAPPIRNNDSADRQDDDLSNIVQQPSSGVCNGSRWRCYARIRTDAVTGQGKIFAQASGFGPPDLASAYKLDTSLDPGATIAIVDAYNYAAAESDLAAYRSQYGLPPCTKANGCLKIVNQNGQTSPLPSNSPSGDDWSIEAALDLDLASAACPNCKLLLIEAQDDQGDGLFIAQNAAASLGATVVSNSWGGPDNGYSSSYETYFNHPGMGSFVASGDSGYNQTPDYPSTSAYVTGVGGTSLVKSSNARGWTEGAWSSGGSSCSNTIAKPSYQTTSSCSKRAAADVSRGRRPQHRPRGLQRQVRWLDRRRRHQRLVAVRRGRLRPVRHRRRRAVVRVRQRRLVLRHHLGQERQLRHRAVQRGRRLGRPDRHGHAQRRGPRRRHLHPAVLGQDLRRRRLRWIVRHLPDRLHLHRRRPVPGAGLHARLLGQGVRRRRLRWLVRQLLGRCDLRYVGAVHRRRGHLRPRDLLDRRRPRRDLRQLRRLDLLVRPVLLQHLLGFDLRRRGRLGLRPVVRGRQQLRPLDLHPRQEARPELRQLRGQHLRAGSLLLPAPLGFAVRGRGLVHLRGVVQLTA